MKSSDLGANAPKVKDDFKKQQPIAGSRKEADELRERLSRPLEPSRSLTIGGNLEKVSHAKQNHMIKERLHQIESGLNRTSKQIQLKSRFKSRTRTRR